MSHGLEIFNSNGGLTYSTEDIAWLHIDTFIVNENSTMTKSYSSFKGMLLKAVVQMVNEPPEVGAGYAPIVTIDQNIPSVTIQPSSSAESEEVIVTIMGKGNLI